jgi:hypothetical protein
MGIRKKEREKLVYMIKTTLVILASQKCRFILTLQTNVMRFLDIDNNLQVQVFKIVEIKEPLFKIFWNVYSHRTSNFGSFTFLEGKEYQISSF